MGRFGEFIVDLVIAAILAGITVAIGAANGHHWTFWIVWLFWLAPCTALWFYLIFRSSGSDGGSADGGGSGGGGFWSFLDDLFR